MAYLRPGLYHVGIGVRAVAHVHVEGLCLVLGADGDELAAVHGLALHFLYCEVEHYLSIGMLHHDGAVGGAVVVERGVGVAVV